MNKKAPGGIDQDIKTSKADVAWNYIGTIVSMAANFVLLPFLLMFLSGDELGLWYIFLAISTLATLFEFGFNPTFARNIVYCLSGARRLMKNGCDPSSIKEGIDWHLLKTVLATSRKIYRLISLVVLLLTSTLGTLYIAHISSGLAGSLHWIAWSIFCIAMFLNMYFLYYSTFLRGFGDIAAENRAKTWSRIAQLLITVILLFFGFGLIGAAVGFFINSLSLRLLSLKYVRSHHAIIKGLSQDKAPVTKPETQTVFSAVSSIAWRDGIVQLSSYVATQGSTIVCSLLLSLNETGVYSIMVQFAMAIGNFSCAYIRSFFPMYQSAFARQERNTMCQIVERGMSAYWLLFIIGSFGVALLIFPLLPLFRPDVAISIPEFIPICLYFALYNQHVMFCNLIVATNRIPYLGGYVASACSGVLLSAILATIAHMGIWGLIIGQLIAQALYNNWRWPKFVLTELHLNFVQALKFGYKYWITVLMSLKKKRKV